MNWRCVLLSVALLAASSLPAGASIVTLEVWAPGHGGLGNVQLELFEDVAPLHVAAFMDYVEAGDFVDNIFHRAIPGFIVQGGAMRYGSPSIEGIPSRGTVPSERQLSNVRGTLALALPSDENQVPLPDEGTSSWFINLGDETDGSGGNTFLDDNFTVFGRVTGDSPEAIEQSLLLLDWVASRADGTFGESPWLDYGNSAYYISYSIQTPEPASLGLMVLGGSLLLGRRRRSA